MRIWVDVFSAGIEPGTLRITKLLKGGPEPLEKGIHKILGWNVRIDFRTLFKNWYKKIQVHFFVPTSLL